MLSADSNVSEQVKTITRPHRPWSIVYHLRQNYRSHCEFSLELFEGKLRLAKNNAVVILKALA